jgi:hypothetical protein
LALQILSVVGEVDFVLSAVEDKDCDQHEHEVPLQKSPHAKCPRQNLPGPTRDPRGFCPTNLHRQEGSKNSSAIHREGRNHVEDDQSQIHQKQIVQDLSSLAGGSAEKTACQPQDGSQHRRDDDIHCRSGHGDDEFLLGFVRNRQHPRHPADGQESNVWRWHPVMPARESVAELMEKHADEKQENKQHRPNGFSGPTSLPSHPSKIQREQQECDVNPHIDPRDPRDAIRPFHKNCFP